MRRPLRYTLFPYTTLFRSWRKFWIDDRLARRGGLHGGAVCERIQPELSMRVEENLAAARRPVIAGRSEEHTSELQSHHDLVCRLLLEKKNQDTLLRSEWLW